MDGIHALMVELRTALNEKDRELRMLRERIAIDLENEAMLAMKSDEYNFNDTAVRSKTFLLAAKRVRNVGN